MPDKPKTPSQPPNLRSKRPDVDWTDVENRYRTGVESLRAIARDYEISEAAIRQRAAKEGWERDLTKRVAIATKAKLLRSETSRAASHDKGREAKAVEIAATTRANLILNHRSDIRGLREHFLALMAELGVVGATRDDLKAIAAELAKDGPDKTPTLLRAKTLVATLVGVHERIDSAKRLGEMLERLIKLERAAFGMPEDAGADDAGNEGGASSSLNYIQRAARLASIIDRARRAKEMADLQATS